MNTGDKILESLNTIESEYRIYAVPEVAQFLKVNERTVFRLIEEGELKSIKVRSLVRVLHDDLEEYLAEAHPKK